MDRVNLVRTSFFGNGSIKMLPAELKKRNFKRVLIVTDKFLYETGVATRVGEEIVSAGIEYAIYYRVMPNPTIEIVNECIHAAKTLQVDALIAVGGGSAIDTCKAVGIVLTNGGRVEDYEGENKSKVRAMPIAAINTTAGTGSEVTAFYIVTDNVRHTKMCMIDTNCMVSIAINDADFMVSMPKGLTAATGMDALTHAVEAVLSWKATPITDKDALWAMENIITFLPRAVADGEDMEARNSMAYAAYTAGVAFSNAGLGMVHAMAHALGGFYNLPHGLCNAVLLPYVMEYNGKAKGSHEKFRKIAKAIGAGTEIENTVQNTRQNTEINTEGKVVAWCVNAIKELSRTVGISDKLAVEKVKEQDIETLSQLAMQDACMKTNIIWPEIEAVKEIYQKVLL